MIGLLLTLHLQSTTWLETRQHARDERGSVTIEHVAWAVAVLVFVGIVVAAIKAYVTTQAGNIK